MAHLPPIIGNAGVERQLARAVTQGRLAQAYLFIGPKGVGTLAMALHFGQYLLCENPDTAQGERLAACRSCRSCHLMETGVHPDLRLFHPDSEGGQNISIKQVRERIRPQAALRPAYGERQVFLLPQAETLSEEAANALLKTIEEPSPGMVFVLGAPGTEQLLPTIRSRSRIMRFGLVSPAEIARALEQELGASPEEALLLARTCGGRPAVAIERHTDEEARHRRAEVLDAFRDALRAAARAPDHPSHAALALPLTARIRAVLGPAPKDAKQDNADEKASEIPWYENPAPRPLKARTISLLEEGKSYLRDLCVLAEGADADAVLNTDRLEELRKLSGLFPSSEFAERMAAVIETQRILDANVQPQLALERLFWRLIAGRPEQTQAMLFRDPLLAPGGVS